MIRCIKDAWYWWLDYVYVTKQQLKSFISREDAGRYRNAGGVPVVLIPGVYENWRFMRPIAKVLHQNGYDIHTIAGLGYNRGTIEEMAQLAQEYITAEKLSGAIIVAHSKGGLIGKNLLKLFENTPTLAGLVAINTPFSGSKYAYLLPVRSLRIFAPRSKELQALAKNSAVNTHIISIYGMFDPHIPGGSKLDGAHNIQLKTYGHFRSMNDPLVHDAIIASVRSLQNQNRL